MLEFRTYFKNALALEQSAENVPFGGGRGRGVVRPLRPPIWLRACRNVADRGPLNFTVTLTADFITAERTDPRRVFCRTLFVSF